MFEKYVSPVVSGKANVSADVRVVGECVPGIEDLVNETKYVCMKVRLEGALAVDDATKVLKSRRAIRQDNQRNIDRGYPEGHNDSPEFGRVAAFLSTSVRVDWALFFTRVH